MDLQECSYDWVLNLARGAEVVLVKGHMTFHSQFFASQFLFCTDLRLWRPSFPHSHVLSLITGFLSGQLEWNKAQDWNSAWTTCLPFLQENMTLQNPGLYPCNKIRPGVHVPPPHPTHMEANSKQDRNQNHVCICINPPEKSSSATNQGPFPAHWFAVTSFSLHKLDSCWTQRQVRDQRKMTDPPGRCKRINCQQ